MNDIILSGMAWASSLRDAFVSRMKEEDGQDLLEYAVLVGAIAVVAGAALLVGGGALDFGNFKDTIQDCLDFNEGGICGG